ncbi:MAG: hypothetical protein M1821_004359 [Bathelium mastoideum]|nr:MAG: hypothetical protein M1821_004359 [Bathelium mastoideum]KAI9683975.1 MAG: hypothetical protein M1822_005802 [Bathelium mastoideum]
MAPVTNLKITPTPFQPSKLGIPSSPFSPRSPLTPPLRPAKQPRLDLSEPTAKEHTSPPPKDPLQWLWKCHVCNHRYAIGATRRCLEDGHHFCSGTTVVARRRPDGKTKFKRHKACTSEFDYQGWKKWANWRREQTGYTHGHSRSSTTDRAISVSSSRTLTSHKDCWNHCDYPSECRWGLDSITSTPVVSPAASAPTTASTSPPTTFESILSQSGLAQQEPTPSSSATPTQSPTRNTMGTNFWHSILSATRTRRLQSVQEEDEDEDAGITSTGNSLRQETEAAVDAMILDIEQSGNGKVHRL